jgi:hypothetical protein
VNTSGTVNSTGPGGYVTGTYSGQSTIMTPGGTTTNYVPYSISRNDTEATFWARVDPRSIRLGVLYEPLPTLFARVWNEIPGSSRLELSKAPQLLKQTSCPGM